MDITLIKINGQGWEFPLEDNWPCAVAFALGDPPDPVTEDEADQQAKLITAAPVMLEALKSCEAALAVLRKNNRWDVHPEDFNDDVDEAIDAQEQARAAIERATK